MKQRITILMLGGGRRVSMAELLKESGKRLGAEVQVVGYELITKVPLASAGKVVQGLAWDDPRVEDDVVRVAQEQEADILIPYSNAAVEVAAKVKSRLPDTFSPVCDADTAAVFFDKLEAAKAFKAAGMPIPRTYSVLNAELPAIAKPRHGRFSRGIKVFTNMDDLMQLKNIKDYLIQAYIPNHKEYTVDCYVTQSGEVLCKVPRLRLEISGGESTRAVTCRLPELQKMAGDVIEAFKLRGLVNIQYLYDEDRDRYLLMEVNPRLASGVVCSIRAGAPIPDYIIGESLGIPLHACDDWCDNTLMTRYWKEEIFYNS